VAITFVAAGPSATTGASTALTSINVSSPTGTDGLQVGDLLILHSATAATAEPVASGVTWTTLEPNLSIGSPGPSHSTWYRWADAGDVAGSTTTLTLGAAQKMAAHIIALRGVDTTTPKDVTTPAGAQSATATVATAPAITTATAGALVVVFAAELQAAGITTNDWASSNTTQRAESTTTTTATNPHHAVFTTERATAGAFTPTVTLTGTSTRSSIQTIALRAGVASVVTRLAPDAILASTGLTGAVAALQDDPDAPDGSWLTA
jgi:hypothetical protein